LKLFCSLACPASLALRFLFSFVVFAFFAVKLLLTFASVYFASGFKVPSSVGTSSVTVGWMWTARWMVV